MLSLKERFIKRAFDVTGSIVALSFLWPVIIGAWIVASFETRSNGFFSQVRIGREGKPFRVYKIKTMLPKKGITTTITTANDMRITKSGAFSVAPK